MAATTVYDVECGACGESTVVGVTRYPATRYEPADGDMSPEECSNCGAPFDDDSRWMELDKSDFMDYDRTEDARYDDYWEPHF